MVGGHPVDLFGHPAVVAAKARLHVENGNVQLDGGQCTGEGGVGVPEHHHKLRLLRNDNLFYLVEHAAGLLTVKPGMDIEKIIRFGQLQVAKQCLRHVVIEMLPGVDDDLPMLLSQKSGKRCQLDELRPCAYHRSNFHGFCLGALAASTAKRELNP